MFNDVDAATAPTGESPVAQAGAQPGGRSPGLTRLIVSFKDRSRFFAFVSPRRADYPLLQYQQAVTDFCRAHGIAVCDLYPAFEGQKANRFWMSLTDPHPNGAANHIAAPGRSTASSPARGWFRFPAGRAWRSPGTR